MKVWGLGVRDSGLGLRASDGLLRGNWGGIHQV